MDQLLGIGLTSQGDISDAHEGNPTPSKETGDGDGVEALPPQAPTASKAPASTAISNLTRRRSIA